MKRIVVLLWAALVIVGTLKAQKHEVGADLGAAWYLGDLGRTSFAGNSYFSDVAGAMARPMGGIHYKYTLNKHFTIRAALAFTMIAGDDRFSKGKELESSEWFRNYRNLHFRSFLLESSVLVEFNVLRFVPGSRKYRWTPYLTAGVGLIAFNPKAEYQGKWVALQPLGTEGQGLPQYPDRKRYSRVQPIIPLGIGIKYNVSTNMVLSFTVAHRFTFTDHLDDVSGTYVSANDFEAAYGAHVAQLVYALSRRSVEKDADGYFAYITKAGEYRGNPKRNDGYLFVSLGFSYVLGKPAGKPQVPTGIQFGRSFY